MFKILKDGSIESDLGYVVKAIGRAGLVYKEKDKILEIDSEILATPQCGHIIASSSISKWKGSTKKISPKERIRIINNIKSAFRFAGYKTQIIKTF